MRLWGAEGVWVRREGRIGGVAGGAEGGCGRGASGVWLGRIGGADVVRMSAPGSFWGLDGTEVLCFRRREEVWAGVDDRAKGFRCDA